MLKKLNILFLFFQVVFLYSFGQTESINTSDDQNRKQGHWVLTNQEKKLPGYQPNQKVEEGKFIDNKKEGKWTFYFNNGKPKHILFFENGSPNGEATFYYKNGNIREIGTWKNNRWVGEYKTYYRNGKLKNHFNFNLQGLKEGKQAYYHENGYPSIVGTWNGGNETGDLSEYNKDGTPNTNRYKEGPSVDSLLSAGFIEDTIDRIDSSKIVKAKKVVPVTPFDGNGYHEFKDRNGYKTKVGEFASGMLVDGKIYKYDASGKLLYTKYVRDGSIIKVVKEKANTDK